MIPDVTSVLQHAALVGPAGWKVEENGAHSFQPQHTTAVPLTDTISMPLFCPSTS